MSGTVANLITDIKLKGFLQTDSTVLTDAEITDIANKELQSVIVPKIISLREDFFLCFKDYTLANSTKRYRLPSRKIGSRISDIEILDSSGNRTSEVRKPRADFTGRWGFTIEGDEVVFRDTVPTGYMRVYYDCRPPTMNSTAAAIATVTAVNSSNLTISVSDTNTRELIRANSPWSTIIPSLTTSTTTATNSDDLIGDTYTGLVQVGDIVIANDSTHIVPLPIELHDWLAQRTVIRIKEYLGHKDELELMYAKLIDMEKDLMALMSPRVTDQERYVVDKESSGWRTW